MPTASDAPLSILLLEAHNFYATTKYEDAVRCLTRALNSPETFQTSTRLEILERRIAAYVKLKKLDIALIDAKSMIKLDRADGRGYLRCGQLEEFKRNHAAAITWYEHGVKRISDDGTLHDLLEKQLIKARELVSSRVRLLKPTDPLTVFPFEVVQMILDFLDYKQHVGILRVSKLWKQIISRIPPITNTIDFRKSNRSINHTMLTASLSRLSRHPHVMILCDLNDAAAKLARSRLERWINYRTLTHFEILESKLPIHSLRFDKFDLKYLKIGPSTEVEITKLQEVLKICLSLQVAVFECIVAPCTSSEYRDWRYPIFHENLRTLEMTWKGIGHFEIAPQVLEQFPKLERLACHNLNVGLRLQVSLLHDLDNKWQVNKLTCLRELITSKCTINFIQTLPNSLEILILNGTYVQASSNETFRLPNLRKLDIYQATLQRDFVHCLTNAGSVCTLEDLSISFDAFPYNDSGLDAGLKFLGLHSYCWVNKLEVLRLRAILADGDTGLFVQEMPNLKKLIVERSNLLTGAFFADLLKSSTCKIKQILLIDCSKVSADIIDWAQSRNVRIDIKTTDSSRMHAGRRIREI